MDNAEHTILRDTYDEIADSGDPWGSCMSFWFILAAELYLRGADVPERWEYHPSVLMTGHEDSDDYVTDIISEISDESLVHFGNILQRYAHLLERAGHSY